MTEDALEQAGEVVETSYNLWREDLQKEDTDDLIRMILNEQNLDIYRIANRMRIDLHALRIMWVIIPQSAPQHKSHDLSQQKQSVKEYLRSNRKSAIVDSFDHGIVAFMDDAPYPGLMVNWHRILWSSLFGHILALFLFGAADWTPSWIPERRIC